MHHFYVTLHCHHPAGVPRPVKRVHFQEPLQDTDAGEGDDWNDPGNALVVHGAEPRKIRALVEEPSDNEDCWGGDFQEEVEVVPSRKVSGRSHLVPASPLVLHVLEVKSVRMLDTH
jgi:hypothetical protein